MPRSQSTEVRGACRRTRQLHTGRNEALAGCAELSRRLDTGVHIHTLKIRSMRNHARSRRLSSHRPIQACNGLCERARHNLRPRNASVGCRLAVHQRNYDISLAHNPKSNMNNGVGYTPGREIDKLTQLGTDGIGADMWREARTAEFKSHRRRAGLAVRAHSLADARSIGAHRIRMLGRESSGCWNLALRPTWC